MILVYWLLELLGFDRKTSQYTLLSMGFLLGLHHFVGYFAEFKHLYCAMQNSYREKMTPYSINYTDKMLKDILILGLFFMFIGATGVVVVYFDF